MRSCVYNDLLQRSMLFCSIALFSFLLQAADMTEGVQMNADKVDFDYENNVSNFSGNVCIKKDNYSLISDEAKLYNQERRAVASGHVLIRDKNRIFFCDDVSYDFDAKRGVMNNASTVEEIWIMTGTKVEQIENNTIRIQEARVSTCTKDQPHFYMTASEIIFSPDREFVAKKATFWLGPVPIFYFPVYKRSLNEDSRFGVRFGVGSEHGFETLTHYDFLKTNTVKATANADLYTKRGVGVGVDAKMISKNSKGKLITYFIEDQEFEPNQSTEEAGTLSRYRISVNNTTRFKNGLKSALEVNKHSDPDIYEDFFRDEFYENVQWDNRYRLYYADEDYSSGVTMRFKTNNFDNMLERLPQYDLNIYEFELGTDTNLYFTSNNHVANLRQNFTDNQIEYDALRGYTGESLSYSKKYFGWLNVNPRVDLEGIWYSDTLGESIRADGSREYADGDLRWVQNYTVDLSTNLTKVFDTQNPVWGCSRFRHILTPGLEYFFRPEPDLEDHDIIQFDEYDSRPETNTLTPNLISRWQGKKDGKIKTLLNTRYFITYDFEAKDDNWTDLGVDSQIRTTDNTMIDLYWTYNMAENRTDDFRTDLSWRFSNKVGLSCFYWYRGENEDEIVAPELSFNFSDDIFIRGYAYYNTGQSLVERSEIAIIKSMHCLDFSTRLLQRDYRDETIIYFMFSPKGMASPGLQLLKSKT